MLPRQASYGEAFLIGLSDLPFWLLFGIWVGVGATNEVAGIIAFAVVAFLYYAWHRCQSMYRCAKCEKTMKHAEVVSDQK